MTLTEIYDRTEELIKAIKQNPEDQNYIFNCEMEMAHLEQLREDIDFFI